MRSPATSQYMFYFYLKIDLGREHWAIQVAVYLARGTPMGLRRSSVIVFHILGHVQVCAQPNSALARAHLHLQRTRAGLHVVYAPALRSSSHRMANSSRRRSSRIMSHRTASGAIEHASERRRRSSGSG